MQVKKKLIVYELNEVPIRVLERFVLNNPNSSFFFSIEKRCFKKNNYFRYRRTTSLEHLANCS